MRCRKPRRGSSVSSPTARMATWSGWRRPPSAARSPQALWPDVRSVIMLGMNYGPDEDPLAILQRARPRRHLGLCQRRRLSRADQGAAEGHRALAGRQCRRRREGVRRHRGGDGKAARRQGRSRLAGQAHEFGVAPIRLVAVSRRDFHHARSAGRRGRAGQLRQLPRLSRYLPDRGVSRSLIGSMRGAAFRI